MASPPPSSCCRRLGCGVLCSVVPVEVPPAPGDRQGNAGQKPDLTPGCRLLLVEEVLQSRELLLLRLVLDGTDARQCAPGRQKVVLDRLDLSDAGHAGGAVALSRRQERASLRKRAIGVRALQVGQRVGGRRARPGSRSATGSRRSRRGCRCPC